MRIIMKRVYRSKKKVLLNYGYLLFMLLFCFISLSAYPCGSFFQFSYILSSSQGSILKLPRTYFYWNLRQIAQKPLEESPYYPKGKWYPEAQDTFENVGVSYPLSAYSPVTHPWQGTLDADCDDLKQCLSKQQIPDASKIEILDRYRKMRQEMRDKTLSNVLDVTCSYYAPHVPSAYYSKEYSDLVNQLPNEFKLYLDGAVQFYAKNIEMATESWMKVLALPKEERRYRTTWASFMIAKTLVDRDPTNALSFFQQTQDAINEGFADSLHCMDEILGWRARAEMKLGKYQSAIHHYYDIYMKGQNYEAFSIQMVCKKFYEEPVWDGQIIQDTLCRRIITAYKVDKRWLNALQQNHIPFEQSELDQLIWQAYQCQEYNTAREWIALQKTPTPIGQWILSKLLLREGKVNEALAILHALVGKFPTRFSQDEVSAELGILLLGQKQFVEAMDFLIKSGYYADMAYIADRVLTTSELENYLINNKKSKDLYQPIQLNNGFEDVDVNQPLIAIVGTPNYYNHLSYILARRYVRENNFVKAKKWMPANLQSLLKKCLNDMKSAKKSKVERGETYYSLARIFKESGLELMGTEVFPDWRLVNGQFDLYPNFLENRTKKIVIDPKQMVPDVLVPSLVASDQEIERITQSAPQPNKRFHYRPLAEQFFWKAANLMPDNDERTAEILYNGGTFANKYAPDQSDKYYKALVRRCRKLPIGQAADKERWFPKELVDHKK